MKTNAQMLIQQHLEKFDYDVRKTGDARFVDQKVTPDVLCIIADCVLNFDADQNLAFTKDDIWNSRYFNTNVKSVFKKPNPQNETTRSEYDKFTSQPLRALAYAGVLSLEKKGRINVYKIENRELLEIIGAQDRAALIFLYYYLTKVLADSNMLRHFETFRSQCLNGSVTENKFQFLKNRFQKFIIGNTAINGETEVNRIFPKVLNVLSCQDNIEGAVRGRLSKHQIYYTDLMYNRPNWRDADKGKSTSRSEAVAEHDKLMIGQNEGYSDYRVQKAVNQIRRMHAESEVNDQWANGEATQVHHIFPKAEFPLLAHCPENLIKLTPTQHCTKAHPSNKTQLIDRDYQLVCLLAKADSVENALGEGGFVYQKENFINVINTGLTESLEYDIDFMTIKRELTRIYNWM